MNVLQLTIVIVTATLINGDCSNKTSVIKNGKEYRMFFYNATKFEAKESCKSWGEQWKSYGGDLMQEIDEDLQRCLKNMIESEKDRFFRENIRGFFLGGKVVRSSTAEENPLEWHWHNGLKIETWAGKEPTITATSSTEKNCMSAIIRGIDNETHTGDWVNENCNAHIYYICERNVPKEFVWGFSQNKHAVVPNEWTNILNNMEAANQCGGEHQSPVDVQLSRQFGKCDEKDVSTVVSWETEQDQDVNWVVTNTGRMVEIKFEPAGVLYSKFHGSDRKLKVDYIHIKWGSDHRTGSEHTIGGVRHAGELQIFHQSKDGEVHALAFMLQQRTFQPNQRWAQLLSHIIRSQEANTSSTMFSPRQHILKLLEDSASIRFYSNPRYIMGSGIRYKGSLTQPPCTENIIWTVYTRPISLSHSQFGVLRHLHMEGKNGPMYRYMTQTTREINNWSPSDFCKVSR